MTYKFFRNCVDWPPHDVASEGGLSDMIHAATDINRRTFRKHVDRDSLREIETFLGYEQSAMRGLTMAGDFAVSYHRSKLHGRTVYFFKWSAMEFVFVKRATS